MRIYDGQVHDAGGKDAIPGKVGGGDLRVSRDSVAFDGEPTDDQLPARLE